MGTLYFETKVRLCELQVPTYEMLTLEDLDFKVVIECSMEMLFYIRMSSYVIF